MKKLVFILICIFFLSNPSFAFFSYDGSITCIPAGAEDYERRFHSEFKTCKEELSQLQKTIRFYKKQYDKCQKKNKYEDWCQDYQKQYEEYSSLLRS